MKTIDFRSIQGVSRFERDFYSEKDDFTYIGDGQPGGKAHGLAIIKEKIISHFRDDQGKDTTPPITIDIPRLTVITTQFFDLFMKQNDLYKLDFSSLSDERIAHHFLKANLPTQLLGDLRALLESVHLPLAVRSSSLLEDSLGSPFAGIYGTKMIPNNQPDADSRFRKLAEAVKFVYASTFFRAARSYLEATTHKAGNEKMAVIIQEVTGRKHQDRFYPDISGVARSYNFYPNGQARPEEGVINLALGLGKAIVDGGAVWSYSPGYPDIGPPYNSISDMMKQTQLDFWAVNMGKPPVFDPTQESEYLLKLSLQEAEYDNTLRYSASTYDPAGDRLTIGVGTKGPRVLNFAPLLQVKLLPLNPLLEDLMKLCEETLEAKVEIEFALSIEPGQWRPGGHGSATRVHFGFLQVRPMALSAEMVEIDEKEMVPEKVLAASKNVMGNGSREDISDIIFVNPDNFQMKNSRAIASEIGNLNLELIESGRPYLLIGFGRWGSSDPWLGIPVDWGQISGARVIVESQLPGVTVDLSQGSHFFHNLTNLGILYFSLRQGAPFPIDWQWLKSQKKKKSGQYVHHVRLSRPLSVKVDGRQRKGVLFK